MSDTFYLYRKPSGVPDVSRHPLNLALFPGYRLIAQGDVRPDVGGKVFNAADALISADTAPPYIKTRALEYPEIKEQLDMLWRAMDKGEIPKAREWYDAIKRVKDANPKSN